MATEAKTASGGDSGNAGSQSEGQGRKEEDAAIDPDDSEEARMEKNRESARNCRLRKKQYIAGLESKVVEYRDALAAAEAETAAWRAKYKALEQQQMHHCI